MMNGVRMDLTTQNIRHNMELKRVVVTGIGAVTPLGNDVPSTWEAAKAGRSGAGPITLFDPEHFKTHFACEVKDFRATDFLDRKLAKKCDRYTHFALIAAKEAIEDSQLDLEREDKDEIGVIVCSGIGGISSLEENLLDYDAEKGPHFSPYMVPKLISDMAAGLISIEYGFRGPNFGTVSACASSTHSIISAVDNIRLGRTSVCLAGGAEAAISVSGVGGFNSLQALSTRNDSPETASRPFSKSRDGFVLGEGGAILVLEEMEHAVARGARIYAEIVGVGMSADAYHITASHPEGLGARLVMTRAMEDAGITPDKIDYINVHGTSTPIGDISEARAIVDLFGDHVSEMSISSTKSMTGHLLGGAGAVEAVLSILALRDGIIPPTINHAEDDVDPDFDPRLDFTFNIAKERPIEYALSNTFGFGGHNGTVILRKWK